MFPIERSSKILSPRWAIVVLALLSLTGLVVTLWILADFSREQEIVLELTSHLPSSDLSDANELAGVLQFQWRMSILLVLNLVASGIAIVLVVNAYLRSERSLRSVHVLATDILASIEQGIITTDPDGRILSTNPFARNILELEGDGTGIALSDLEADHATLDEICRRVFVNEVSLDQVYKVMNKAGDRHLRAGCSLLRVHSGRKLGTVIHLRDVTEKTLMEQRLRRMERYMGLGSLAAGLQHEIKNPLGALALHVQLLSETLEQQNPSVAIREILDVLSTETKRIISVLEGFRDFASVAELEFEYLEPSTLVDELVRLIQPQAIQQGILLQTNAPSSSEAHFLADAVRIKQVLLNLIVNAMAAMPKGGQLSISAKDGGSSIEFAVADTGSGIPEQFQDKVFDPYFTTRSTGTGMGLAISEKIVRQHQGMIEFHTSSKGTIFTVTLPKQPPR